MLFSSSLITESTRDQIISMSDWGECEYSQMNSLLDELIRDGNAETYATFKKSLYYAAEKGVLDTLEGLEKTGELTQTDELTSKIKNDAKGLKEAVSTTD